MGYDVFSEIANRAIKVSLYISSPMLIGALLIGILVSIFQAVTQINEQTLSFIPKILIIVASMVIFAPWMAEVMTGFTRELILSVPEVIRNN
jgi:flagellar biosynthetic protein FliQ